MVHTVSVHHICHPPTNSPWGGVLSHTAVVTVVRGLLWQATSLGGNRCFISLCGFAIDYFGTQGDTTLAVFLMVTITRLTNKSVNVGLGVTSYGHI